MEQEVKTKKCGNKNCAKILPYEDFYKCSKSPNGRESYCKKCKKEVNQKINLKKKEGIIEFF